MLFGHVYKVSLATLIKTVSPLYVVSNGLIAGVATGLLLLIVVLIILFSFCFKYLCHWYKARRYVILENCIIQWLPYNMLNNWISEML